MAQLDKSKQLSHPFRQLRWIGATRRLERIDSARRLERMELARRLGWKGLRRIDLARQLWRINPNRHHSSWDLPHALCDRHAGTKHTTNQITEQAPYAWCLAWYCPEKKDRFHMLRSAGTTTTTSLEKHFNFKNGFNKLILSPWSSGSVEPAPSLQHNLFLRLSFALLSSHN